MTLGDAWPVSSAGRAPAPCSALRHDPCLLRCTVAARSSPGTWRRCARSSVCNQDLRSADTHRTHMYHL